MRRWCALAIALVLSVGLVACDGGEEPQPPPQSEDSVEVTDEAATSTRPEDAAGQTADPGVPEMPPLATEDSEAGAEAFAEYYIEMVNYLGQYPRSGVLEDLATDGCSTCDNFESSVSELEQAGERRSGPIGEVETATALGGGEGYEALLRVEMPAYEVLDSEGEVVHRFSAGTDAELRFDLQSGTSGHLVRGVYLIES